MGPTGREKGVLLDLNGSFSKAWMEATLGFSLAIGDVFNKLVARMPMVYLHLVQVLVDTLTVLTPFALYAKLGVTSVVLSGLIVIFYRGLLKICKSMFDPYGDVTNPEIEVPVLVRNVNEDSTRFLSRGQVVPAA